MTPYYQDEHSTIYHGDCREILPQLEPVDLVLTDPPYGIGKLLTDGGKTEWVFRQSDSVQWDLQPIADDVMSEVLFCSSEAIIWGGQYYTLPPRRGWLIWDKMQEHSSGHAELAWTTLDMPPRLFRLSRVEAYAKGKFHPTEKPLPLILWCFSFCPSVATILDPFMGSGTTLVAAKQLGRKAIGIEIEEKYCKIAVERLRQGVLPLARPPASNGMHQSQLWTA